MVISNKPWYRWEMLYLVLTDNNNSFVRFGLVDLQVRHLIITVINSS
mgnify:CR=1 FL=1